MSVNGQPLDREWAPVKAWSLHPPYAIFCTYVYYYSHHSCRIRRGHSPFSPFSPHSARVRSPGNTRSPLIRPGAFGSSKKPLNTTYFPLALSSFSSCLQYPNTRGEGDKARQYAVAKCREGDPLIPRSDNVTKTCCY